jgi:MoaA/NifB/PqqE/SkfB family radical SAM enzyme
LDIEVIKRLLTTERGGELRKIEFCGNIDEPLAHPKLLELVEHIVDRRPEVRVSIHTNGGIGTADKFLALSRLLARGGAGSNFRFSIDGLEDTNHIYRQNVRWPKLYENLQAALAGGAQVIWQYLVFPWNDHQIDEAKKRAHDLGCSEFWLRPDRSLATSIGLEHIRELKQKDLHRDPPPGRLSDLRSYAQLKGKPIVCSFRNEGMLFLSWEGKVWPCCFISNVLYETDLKRKLLNEHLVSKYPPNFNSLYHHSFDEILAGPLFRRDLVKSWEKGGAQNKLAFRCVERCSSAKLRSSDHKPDDRSHYERLSFQSPD